MKSQMTDAVAISKIKELLRHDRYEALKAERNRINTETIPRINSLFAGLELKYKETGEVVKIVEIGQLFETITAKFPNGSVLWCIPEEFEQIKPEADE